MAMTNFGGNVRFTPRHLYVPKTEAEVLAILDRHAHGRIRVLGAGHSWNDVARSDDVMIDMRHFRKVERVRTGFGKGDAVVTVGAGSELKKLLDALHRDSDYTLPTMGASKKQTIAGLISTATHGSGRPSLSHYVHEIRAASYDPGSGKARICDYRDGDELRAARCALGCMGVILSATFKLVPKYHVTQAVERRESLEEVLAGKETYPLQQFVLIPYSWRYFVWTRRLAPAPPRGREKLRALTRRVGNLAFTDILLHLVLKGLLAVSSSRKGVSRAVRGFYKRLPSRLVEKRAVTDFSENALTQRHDLFRHLEMEIFVPERHVRKAMEMIRCVTSVFAASDSDVPPGIAEELQRIGKLEELRRHRGFFTHHYPIFCRQVRHDDTLISMTASAQEREWFFSVSLFTYLAPDRREHFLEFAEFIARVMAGLYDGRPHWGKHLPLAYDDIAHLYPNLEHFRRVCRETDPKGVFQNDYTRRVLGFVTPGSRPSTTSGRSR